MFSDTERFQQAAIEMRVLGSCRAKCRSILAFDSAPWDVHDIAHQSGHLEFCIGLVARPVTYTAEFSIVRFVFDQAIVSVNGTDIWRNPAGGGNDHSRRQANTQ